MIQLKLKTSVQLNLKVMDFYLFKKNVGKNISGKYGAMHTSKVAQKLFDSAKKSAIDSLKTAS